jgi:hypothetical protein
MLNALYLFFADIFLIACLIFGRTFVAVGFYLQFALSGLSSDHRLGSLNSELAA